MDHCACCLLRAAVAVQCAAQVERVAAVPRLCRTKRLRSACPRSLTRGILYKVSLISYSNVVVEFPAERGLTSSR